MRVSSLLSAFRIVLVACLIVGPVIYASQQQKQMRNFRVVKEGVLYRSGQMSPEGLRRAINEYGIRTVVSLRDSKTPGDFPPDAQEEAYLVKDGFTYLRLNPLDWDAPEGKVAPVQDNVDQFLEVMRDPKNYPVLIHCFAGKHRTGAYCAIYRMEFDGWDLEDALKEIKANGYPEVEEHNDLMGYLTQYRVSKR